MKSTLFIFCIAAILSSCSTQPTIDYALISGKIENFNNQDFKVISTSRAETIINVDETGLFSDTLRLKEGSYVLALGKEYANFYITHGAQLQVATDASDFTNTISFTGIQSGMSNYLLAKNKLIKEERGKRGKSFTLDENAFWEEAKNSMTKLTEELEKLTDISDSLRSLELRAIKAEYLYKLNYYSYYHVSFLKNQEYTPADTFLSAMNDFDYNDEALFHYSRDYRSLLEQSIGTKGKELFDNDEATSTELGKTLAASKINNDVIREEMLYSSVRHSLSMSKDKDALYETYMKFAAKKEYIETINKKYIQLSKLDKGQPSPKFVDYENYKGGTSSLDDFKGKYVYIDVWATWCGPCRAEIPHLKRIEKKYHNKNIEFISISIDKENAIPAWKKMIAEKELGGIQLRATDKKIMTDFVISGIPHFILIDPMGNIVDKNAPRPSNEKLLDLFKELGL